MGAALDWLGPEGCRQLAESILVGVDTHVAKAGELGAHCPFHVESTPGGAFHYNWQQDVGHCMSCDGAGDLIAIWCAQNGYDLASQDGFRAFREKFAPDAKLSRVDRPQVQRRPEPRRFEPETKVLPPAQWSERAESFVTHATERLLQDTRQLENMARWGITLQTVEAARIGYNPVDKYPTREAWGLPTELKENGKPLKLWLPAGFVFPFVAGGAVIKIKIRVDSPGTYADGRDKPRYRKVVGGWDGMSVYDGGRPSPVYVVVETERDAMLVRQELRLDGVGAVATGGASMRPDARTYAVLAQARLILVALDGDGPGATNAWRWWMQEFAMARRWPSPPSYGKDVGDAVGMGLDVRRWVLEGVPPHVLRELERSMRRPHRQVAEPEQSSPAPAPDVPAEVLALREVLGRCPTGRARVRVNLEAGEIGLADCIACKRANGCDAFLLAGARLFAADGVVMRWIENGGTI